ncbi:MAG: WD repeat-containing protein 4 [Trizodia sp. TS-e1964]|nr:MAG: WD repeat-containing protein 4 [Trizodia sp. TS-e1964]
MRHPYQCLCICSRQLSNQVLIAAAGSKIYSFTLKDGALRSTWTFQRNELPKESQKDDDENAKAKSPKRPRSKSPVPSKNQRPSRSRAFPLQPNVVQLVASKDSKFLLAVTGEDKCISVFAIGNDGALSLLSERCMPKRPSSVSLTFDGSTILCADKFGDVYSLPLLCPSTDASIPVGLKIKQQKIITQESTTSFSPSANKFTVHTARNRKALENQLSSKGVTVSEKPTFNFEHHLIIGHVSMLTDVVSQSIKDPSGNSRSYIITSDRDEHIRVSRGIPQAHIIESFCLGHKEFVSRIYIPSWSPKLLVSGGGDDHIFLWDWMAGSLKQKLNLKNTAETGLGSCLEDYSISQDIRREGTSFGKERNTLQNNGFVESITVSGIWGLNFDSPVATHEGYILIACEGLPALFVFKLKTNETIEHHQTITLSGNCLSLAINTDDSTIMISIDNIHIPGSSTKFRDTSDTNCSLLQCYKYTKDIKPWEEIKNLSEPYQISDNLEYPIGGEGSIADLLYSFNPLRKRKYGDDS